MVFRWEPGAATRIGLRASFAGVAIAILLAVFQVQGWTMPKLLAVALIAVLIAMIIVALSTIVYEVAQAFRRFLEHHATTASWVAEEHPGFLDYEPDGIRAQKRFTGELNKLARDTSRLGSKMDRHRRRMERGVTKSPRGKQRLADRAARDIARSAGFLEKRHDLLEAIVKDVSRNTEGIIASVDLRTQDDLDIAKQFAQVLDGMGNESATSAESTAGYAQSVRELEEQNPARTVRIACQRLGAALESVVKTLRRVEGRSHKAAQNLGRRIAEAEKEQAKRDE